MCAAATKYISEAIHVAKRNIDGMAFFTIDRDHDLAKPHVCAAIVAPYEGHGAGWWYNDCAYGEPIGGANFFRWFYVTDAGLTLTGMMLQTSRMITKKVGGLD